MPNSTKKIDLLTPEELDVARHALGFPNKSNISYRNHYVTAEDDPIWCGLVEKGYAKLRPAKTLPYGGDAMFWLTREGAEAAIRGREKLDERNFPLKA